MELFKERLLLLLYFVVLLTVIFAIAFIVFLPVMSLAILKPHIMLIVLLIGLAIGVGYLIHWLLLEPYKEHKKAKNEHSTKFKVN